MTLHLLYGRWWPIVCTPSNKFFNCQNDCIPGAVCTLLPASTYPQWCIQLHVIRLFAQGPCGLPDTQRWGINLVAILMILRVRHPPPWLEVHFCAYLSSYWLISFILGYQEIERQRTLYNLPMLYKKNESFMTNLVLYDKDKWLCHKTISCLVLSQYMCVHMCIMNLHVHGMYRFIFVFSL